MNKVKLDVHMQSFFNYLETLKHSSDCDFLEDSGAECTCHYSISVDIHELLIQAKSGRGVEASKKFDEKYPWLSRFNY